MDITDSPHPHRFPGRRQFPSMEGSSGNEQKRQNYQPQQYLCASGCTGPAFCHSSPSEKILIPRLILAVRHPGLDNPARQPPSFSRCLPLYRTGCHFFCSCRMLKRSEQHEDEQNPRYLFLHTPASFVFPHIRV